MTKIIFTIALIAILIIVNIFFVSQLIAQPKSITKSPYSDSLNNNTSVKADSIYNFITSNEHLIDFEDCNICKSRAHIMCRAIEKKFAEVKVYKVWLIADSRRISQKEKYRYKQNIYLQLPGICYNWIYHVAPAALINGDTIVFDPSTKQEPVSLKNWTENLIMPGGTAYLIIKDKDYYFYPESSDNFFLDDVNDWNTGEPKMRDEKCLRSIDDILRAKHGYFEPWKFNYYISELLKLVE